MKVKLGEVCIFQRGQTITKKDIINGDVPVVAGGQTPAYYHNKANREKNIITISSSGYAGYVNFWTVPIFCSDSFTVKPKDDNQFIIRYLYFFLKSRQEYIYSLSRGCGIKHIYSSDIAPFEIELVDIQTQKEIVSILDNVTSLISMRKEQLEKLDILVKSKFIEMFGDPVLNPKGWEKKKLGEVCDVRDGTHDSPKFRFTGYPLVTSKNIVNNQLVLDKVNYISQDDYDKINKRSKVDKGDILLPMIGTIGNPVVINIEPNFAIKNVALIKFNNPNITNTYIYNILTSNYIEYVKNILSRGGTQKFIALADIRKLIIPIPPLDLQNQFAEFVEQVEKNKENIKSSLNQLETLYSALMQEYFG